MSTTAIQCILFDFGGVLAEEGFKNGLRRLAAEQQLDVADIAHQGMLAVYDSGFVLGRGSAEAFWSLLRQRTGLQGDDRQLTARMMEGFVVRDWMIELVKKLRRQGYVTGILSDQTDWLDKLDQQYHFYAAFDRIYNSYYLGKGKRDRSLFSEVAADLHLPVAAILFVDDDAGNVERARNMGMQALHFRGRQQFLRELQQRLGHKET